MLGFSPLSTYPISTVPFQDKASASVSANATVFLDAIRFAFDNASVSASATVDGDSIRLRLVASSVNGTATIVAQPNAIFTFVSDINGIAVADLTPNIIASAGANINGNAQYLIDAELVGENWTVVPEGTNIWLQRG